MDEKMNRHDETNRPQKLFVEGYTARVYRNIMKISTNNFFKTDGFNMKILGAQVHMLYKNW